MRPETMGSGLLAEKLSKLWLDHAAWSQATFGSDKDRGPEGPLKHLQKEAAEVLEARTAEHALEELADCLLLLMDATRRSYFSLSDLVTAAQAKLEVNKKREWPVPTSPNQPIEHKRE